jgi:hypothetical protein
MNEKQISQRVERSDEVLREALAIKMRPDIIPGLNLITGCPPPASFPDREGRNSQARLET